MVGFDKSRGLLKKIFTGPLIKEFNICFHDGLLQTQISQMEGIYLRKPFEQHLTSFAAFHLSLMNIHGDMPSGKIFQKGSFNRSKYDEVLKAGKILEARYDFETYPMAYAVRPGPTYITGGGESIQFEEGEERDFVDFSTISEWLKRGRDR